MTENQDEAINSFTDAMKKFPDVTEAIKRFNEGMKNFPELTKFPDVTKTMKNFTDAMKNFPCSTSTEALNESVRLAKESHIALNDPRWEWTGSTAFSDVWCWLPIFRIEYADIDYPFNARIGFTSTGQRLFMTGQKASFFVRVSSLNFEYPNWSSVANLNVVTELVPIDELINVACESAYGLLASHLQEVNRKNAGAFRKEAIE